MIITFGNYYIHTRATFRGCKKPKSKPDYVSRSGSLYWYGKNMKGEYVIRYSDHWTNVCGIYSKRINPYASRDCKRIATCLWKIKTNHKNDKKIIYCGKCYLNSFTKTKVFI
jgi:hypothetical protein